MIVLIRRSVLISMVAVLPKFILLWHSLPLDHRSVDTVDAFKKKLNENLLLFRILFYIKKNTNLKSTKA